MPRSRTAVAGVALVCLFGFLVSCGGEGKPALVGDLVHAVDSVGFVTAEAFRDTVHPEAEMQKLRGFLENDDGLSAFEETDSVLLDNPRYMVGIDSATSFYVVIYYDRDHVRLVRATAPVVNATSEDGGRMLESLYAVAERLGPEEQGVRSWVESAWQRAWKNYYREGSRREDVVSERRVGDFKVAVSGVPPDIVTLEAVATSE